MSRGQHMGYSKDLYLSVLYWQCCDVILDGCEELIQVRYRHLEMGYVCLMEVEATEMSEIFKSIASKRRPTAVISCSMRSVASARRGSVGGVVEQGGVISAAMGFGSAIALENNSWQECLPDDVLLGIAT
ncbi:hypothetical protein NDU88_003576 [Pleurodeles waltl]|uniref:Uncharacterized protein n=1 Tax=Pleurodeles waltl TaxID=8319 RepID=A0AAV7UYV4_PLEWA|nr:hypothetical protein NDU88_003576 [Pleurodeles waltl]